MSIHYDPTIHIPVRAAANASRGISYSTSRHGEPAKLLATREDGSRKTWPVIAAYDPQGTPKAAYHGPGAYRFVVLRSDLTAAESFAAGPFVIVPRTTGVGSGVRATDHDGMDLYGVTTDAEVIRNRVLEGLGNEPAAFALRRFSITAPVTRWDLGYALAVDEKTARSAIASSWRSEMKGRPQARHGYGVTDSGITEDSRTPGPIVIWY